jgi:tellurite resistance protein TerC
VLAITTEPFIVFAANAFALLGLRSLFFLVIGSLTRIRYLNAGLGAILVLVGTKMLIADWWKMPIWVSLPAIIGILAVTVLVSLRVGPPTRRPAPRPLAPEGGR